MSKVFWKRVEAVFLSLHSKGLQMSYINSIG